MPALETFWNICSCSVFRLFSCISAIKSIKIAAYCGVCHFPVNNSEPLYYRVLLQYKVKYKRSTKHHGFSVRTRGDIVAIRLARYHELAT